MERTVVEARGEQCPIPVVKAKKAADAMTGGGILEVHVDNETAVQNLLRMAAGMNGKAVSEGKGEKHFVVTIEVPADAAAAEDAGECSIMDSFPVEQKIQKNEKTVAAIGSAYMGNGDDKLGAILMKGFLFALSQQEALPDTVLFYNGGAFLTTEGSASLDDIRSMEERGVRIMTCGTCLDFYGLKEKLAVGSVTNMYDIVSALTAAGKIIKP
ncbi:MAG: sulfurtransferase-like selenium metabolism protein YedF [Lachnospiraceae bacterium]|nr:sulfurtransferase-like selenium metabolism protein YedF [Lachnospiraceae bacterium]